jgi:hypothetical protein
MYISQRHGPRQIKSTARRRKKTKRANSFFSAFGRLLLSMMEHFSLLFGNFLGRKFPTAPPIKGRASVWPDGSRQLFLSRWRSTQLTSDTTATHLVNLELIERAEPSQTPFLLRHKSLLEYISLSYIVSV